MAVVATVAGGPFGGGDDDAADQRARGLQRAAALLGVSTMSLSDFFDPLYDVARITGTSANGGSATLLSPAPGGIIRLSTGAAAANGNGLLFKANFQIASVLTERIYLRAVAKFRQAAIPTQEGMAIGLILTGGTHHVGIGVYGSGVTGGSDTHYSISRGTGGTRGGAQTSVAIDTNWHTFELWTDGAGNLLGSVDETTAATIAIAPLAAANAQFASRSATGVIGTLELDIDHLHVIQERV